MWVRGFVCVTVADAVMVRVQSLCLLACIIVLFCVCFGAEAEGVFVRMWQSHLFQYHRGLVRRKGQSVCMLKGKYCGDV